MIRQWQQISAIKVEVQQVIMKSMVIWSTQERDITIDAILTVALLVTVQQVIVRAMRAIVILKGEIIITWKEVVIRKGI